MPKGKATRLTGRSPVAHLQLVTVYRDRRNLPYQEMMAELDDKAEVYALFSVLAILHDASPGGVGLRFEGQQLRAQNLLHPGERYALDLTLSLPEVPDELAPFLRGAPEQHLLVRAACRWDSVTKGVSRVGFEFLDTNPPPVLRFLAGRLGTWRPLAP